MATEQTLDSIVLKVQGLINEAQERMREYQIERLRSYFTAEGKPLTEKFSLSGGRALDVPRYSLAPQSCLAIDEVELRFAVPAGPGEAERFREAAGVKKPSRFKMLFERLRRKKRRDIIEVKVLFKAGEPEKQGV
ncbi:hypothetical protein FACS1894137_08560 [Spirochaetia bacterium]|nr:hypothetical protein FACS1894137_08560 [Spirochaetia bacterium]